MKKPAFEWMDKVEFDFYGVEEPLVGLIEVVDDMGTFFQDEEPSYDIYVSTGRAGLYKHVQESQIRRRLVNERITGGVLEYDEKRNLYTVKTSSFGVAIPLDKPEFTEIRLAWSDKWLLAAYVIEELPEEQREEWMNLSITSLKEWVGKSVEIRYVPPYLQVSDLINTHQDDSDMIYEIYKEDANVVLFDGDFVKWSPENLVLRGTKHHALEYYHEKVYRWDVAGGVVRLCLGNIPAPSQETIDAVQEWMKKMEEKERKVPEVSEFKKQIIAKLRIEELPAEGLKRMIRCANEVVQDEHVEIMTPVTKYGFEYKKGDEWHKVYYQYMYLVSLIDAIVSEG